MKFDFQNPGGRERMFSSILMYLLALVIAAVGNFYFLEVAIGATILLFISAVLWGSEFVHGNRRDE